MSKRGRVLAFVSTIALIAATAGFLYVARSRTSAAASRESDLASRASAGDAGAQVKLGLQCLRGTEHPPDYSAAVNVAQRCELGRGVATNLVEAWKWYHLAELGGVADAAKAKGSLETRMSAPQVAEARDAAAHFPRQSPATRN